MNITHVRSENYYENNLEKSFQKTLNKTNEKNDSIILNISPAISNLSEKLNLLDKFESNLSDIYNHLVEMNEVFNILSSKNFNNDEIEAIGEIFSKNKEKIFHTIAILQSSDKFNENINNIKQDISELEINSENNINYILDNINELSKEIGSEITKAYAISQGVSVVSRNNTMYSA